MARLDELCIINMGQSPDSSTYNEDGNGLPFFQGNADFGATYPVVRMWCSEPTKRAQIDDILISVRAPIGALNIANCECCIGRGLAALTVNKNSCIQKYLWYALSNKVEELNSKGTGSTFKAINKKILAETEIPLTSLDEQRKIAAVLDKVSDLIAKRRQQLDKLDELVQARFVEMFGDPIINNMSWPKALIGDNCFVTKLAGFEYTQYIHYEDSGDVVMVKAQNVKKGKLNDKDISFISNEVSDSLPRSQLAPGDVVMTYVGANIGDVALIDEKHKYHLAPNVAKIRPNSKVYDSTYFMYMLMFLNSYIMENSADTAKAALGMERIRKLVVCIPPIDLQRYFSDFVKKIDKSKSVVQKSLEQLETLKKALMQEYFG